jgi:hypothetical protein
LPRVAAVLRTLGPGKLFGLLAFPLAFGFAWVLSGPAVVPVINWDAGAYLASFAMGTSNWSSVPWNNHMGVSQEYLIGCWLAKLFGGTTTDGFRLLGAVFFAAAFVTIADTLRILTRSYLLAALLALAWATSWVNLHYHLIVEDNMFFLAPAAGVLRICILRSGNWRWRDSLICGALVTLAFLGSWQAAPYLMVPMWAAVLAGRQRRLWMRVRDTLLVPGAAFATLMLWAGFSVVTSELTWRVLKAVIFSRPSPSFLPQTTAGLMHILKHAVIFDTLGTGVAYHLTFSAYQLSAQPPLSTVTMGVLALLFQVALFVGLTFWSWKRRELPMHLLAGMLLLFTLVTSLHKDLATYAELKRFDFVPLFLVMLAGTVLGAAQLKRGPRLALTGALALLIVFQTALGLRWARRERASYVTTKPWAELPHPPNQIFGREGRGWFGYFRRLRQQNPQACRFVFVASELDTGWWNFDMVGALYAELPDHLSIGPPGIPLTRPLSSWRYHIKFATVADARRKDLVSGCAWLSEDARTLLARTPP